MEEKNGVWLEEHTVHTSNTDLNGQAKLSFLLDMLQWAADSAVGALGVSLEKMLEAQMGWMLITLDLELKRTPRQGELLTIQTWSKGTKGALWQRDYRIFDAAEKEIACARSIWALVDTDKRKILRPSALPVEVQHYTGDSVGEPPSKVSLPQEIPLTEVYTSSVRYSGLDQYGHLNNARYGDLCCDALPVEQWSQHELRRFIITYQQEAKHGDEICIHTAVDEANGVTWVRGADKAGKVYFEAMMEWSRS